VVKYAIFWTPEAIYDLKAIFNYIKNVESRSRASYVVEGIRKKVKETLVFPEKHPKEPNIDVDNVRFIIKWSYKIVFEIKENTIRILSVFHTSQNPDKLKNMKI
jgi:plasmid stabilization system protein ParE